ncbi:TPA: hypothetical protein HA235_00370 [Candidatus Woesearchaeota archaeon]|nr:60S ribosomal protein L31 [Candidatus Woesearchaeota archaeon]HIH31138.1 hypothetical protein [Candidatus Woesearchaeota archaeon]HIH54619.1 hypothetical protein [Candidatus Woesearchaeota archaeon]HIJ02327.1 hypothetical protein [Candidatus Woesearchaeota archaeon]HIJ14195.1 hypothetical protein [Candidatus Woesearchaeota archaeon]
MIERTYIVPLRKGFINKARYKKAKKAVSTLQEFLKQHMKSDKIRIGKNLNEYLWKHGIKNPPHHVKVSVIKEDDGTVKAELHGFKYDHMKKEEKEKQKDKKESAEKKVEEKKKETKKMESEETADVKEETPKKQETKKSSTPKKVPKK